VTLRKLSQLPLVVQVQRAPVRACARMWLRRSHQYDSTTGTVKSVGYDLTYRSQKEHDKLLGELISNLVLLIEKMPSGRISDSLQVS